jgi:hypothetical protein
LNGTFGAGRRKYVMWRRKAFVIAVTTAAGSW